MKIKTRLIVFAFILSILPLFFISFLFFQLSSEHITEETFSKLTAVANEKKARIETMIQLNHERIHSIVSRTPLRVSLWRYSTNPNELERQKMNDIIRDIRGAMSDYQDIFIANEKGEVVTSTDPSLLKADIRFADYFKKAQEQNYIDIIETDKKSRVIVLAGPLILNKSFIGVAVVYADAQSFINAIQDYTGLGRSGDILLAKKDREGNVRFIAPRRFEEAVGAKNQLLGADLSVPMAQAISGKEETFFEAKDYRGVPVLAVTRFLANQNWGLVIKIDESEAFQSLQEMRTYMIYAVIVIAVLALLCGLFMARTIYQPIDELRWATKQVGEQKFDIQLSDYGQTELGQLAKSFETMATKVKYHQESTDKELQERIAAEQRLKQMTEELEKANKRLEHLTVTDPLTGCLNRRGLQQILSREHLWIHRGYKTSALLVDLDDFKSINDKLGYAAGDILLKEVVQRVMSIVRVTDYVARVGGDEFIVLLPETDIASAMVVAEKIRQSVSTTPLMILNKLTTVTGSIGAAEVTEETNTIDELLIHTQVALHKSKQAGKNRVVFAEDGKVEEADTASIVGALSERASFRVLKQPIVDLKTDKVVGYEFLSRFNHGSFDEPDDFFKICMENNVLTIADLCCFKNCIDAALKIDPPSMSHLNLFPSTILDVDGRELAHLIPNQKKGHLFSVEISEQQIIGDPKHLKSAVDLLKQNGISVGIDDIGFGRSSLESLLILEPDFAKIDKKIVIGSSKDKGKARTFERLVQVLQSLGVQIVAEGVETEADKKLVLDFGITHAQGYLFGRPE